MQGNEEDSEWCDVSNEDIPKVGSDGNDQSRVVHSESVEEVTRLDTSMPTLFSNDLPPCGLMPQLAYENVVHRLRKLWLQGVTRPSASLPVHSVCLLVLAELKSEEEEASRSLSPWRRESVFQYELRWAKYFVREAETAEKRLKMTEKQLDKQEFMDRMYPIPKELKIPSNQKNQKTVLELWKKWHHGKRGTVETEDHGLGIGGAREDVEGTGSGGEESGKEKEKVVDRIDWKEEVEAGNEVMGIHKGMSEEDQQRIMQEAEKRLQLGD